jgi:putative transposase
LSNIILSLCLTIQIQFKIMCYLIGFITGKHSLRSLYDEPVRKEYRKLQVDTMPVIDSFERLNYVELLKEYLVSSYK